MPTRPSWRLAAGRVMDDLFASQPIAGATLVRSDIERLIGRTPRTLIDCDVEEADLSGLDLTRGRFERFEEWHREAHARDAGAAAPGGPVER